MKKVKLLMFSGGVDSTYILWYYLTKTNHIVHAHHINIINKAEPRWKQEKEAVDNIREYCYNHYRTFEYSESTYEFNDFINYIGRDLEIHLLLGRNVSGNLSVKYPNHEINLVIGAINDDFNVAYSLDMYQRGIGNTVWKALHSSLHEAYRKNISDTIERPLLDMNIDKKGMIKEMPDILFEYSWSCRTPINNTRCGNCRSCRDVQHGSVYQNI